MRFSILILLGMLSAFPSLWAQDTSFPPDENTLFEQSNGKQTCTYEEGIRYFRVLANKYPQYFSMQVGKNTDAGLPLHYIIVSQDGTFQPLSIKEKNKTVILINNAIHPGEPDGVDASMLWIRSFAHSAKLREAYKDLVVVIIPFYNIGGALHRNSFSRANQVGPESYGFRGNAKNLDLNRDFIKADAENTFAFYDIFHRFAPSIFLDTHVSNGADYPYVMTLLSTESTKLGGELGDLLKNEMNPFLYKSMENKGIPMAPYVNVFGDSPENGYDGFMDLPRYSSGYASLFSCISFVSETHMLKPYQQRVYATLALINSILEYSAQNNHSLKNTRTSHIERIKNAKKLPLRWEQDREQHTNFLFSGYKAKYKESKVTNGKRLWYDRNDPFTKNIPIYNFYKETMFTDVPKAYYIPQAWGEVIRRLKANGVICEQIQEEESFFVEAYSITSFKSTQQPYEGHFPITIENTKTDTLQWVARKGDWIIPCNQEGIRYIMETLEPMAPDSFLVWNFFDTILQRKEWYSSYVFEDLAEEYLKEHPELREQLNIEMKKNSALASSPENQLYYIYTHSPWSESTYLRYPIFRIIK